MISRDERCSSSFFFFYTKCRSVTHEYPMKVVTPFAILIWIAERAGISIFNSGESSKAETLL